MKGFFPVIILVVFVFAAIVGLLVFSGAIPIGKSDTPGSAGSITIWGTLRKDAVDNALQNFTQNNQQFIITYQQKSSQTFDRDLLEAIATGVGPDLVFLSDDLILHYANKIATIPYQSYPIATFKNSYVSAGEVFLNSKGILSLPIIVDPLVMYYNRNMFDSNSIVYPPKTWDEILSVVPKLTKKDESNKIIKSGVALGHFSNIDHAKDILATLFLQTGNPIVSEKNGSFVSSLSNTSSSSFLSDALRFYTGFADPNNPIYSWNRSFSNSSNAFSKEDLAIYFGFGSEFNYLINQNPNHNFYLAPIPQIKDAKFKSTIARVTGLSVLASSKNTALAYSVMGLLSTGDFTKNLANLLGAVPARRDLLINKPEDPIVSVLYDSALFSRAWPDPSSSLTNDIFRKMIDGVISNSVNINDAITDADSKLNLLLLK